VKFGAVQGAQTNRAVRSFAVRSGYVPRANVLIRRRVWCVIRRRRFASASVHRRFRLTASVEAAGQDAHLTQVEVARAFPHV
jgi:hypothetical protein